jgi:hypothetical protein
MASQNSKRNCESARATHELSSTEEEQVRTLKKSKWTGGTHLLLGQMEK